MNERDKLITFVHNQTFGPFVLDDRFVPVGQNPIDFTEILDAPPGLYYSTGILFPRSVESEESQTKSTLDDADADYSEDTLNTSTEEFDATSTNTDYESQGESPSSQSIAGENDDLTEDSEWTTKAETQESVLNASEAVNTGNQTYPGTMGMTFAIAADAQPEDLNIQAQVRIYRKATPEERLQIGLRLDMDISQFSAISKLMGITNEITISKKGPHFVLTIKQTSSDESLKDVTIDKQQRFAAHFKELYPNLSALISEESINKTRASLIAEYRKGNTAVAQGLLEIDHFLNFKQHISRLRSILTKEIWLGFTPTLEPVYPTGFNFDIDSEHHMRHLTESDKIILYQQGEMKLNMNVLLINGGSLSSSEGTKYLKIQLENSSSAVPEDIYSIVKSTVNERSFFGVTLTVRSEKIRPYDSFSETKSAEPSDTSKFIYRLHKQYGVSHGCSIDWTKEHNQIVLKTTYLPAYEAPLMETNPVNSADEPVFPGGWFNLFDLSSMSNLSNEGVLDRLSSLCEAYSKWISAKEAQWQSESFAINMMEGCKADYMRMNRNVSRLKEQPEHLNLFRHANTAMYWQMGSSSQFISWANGEAISFPEKQQPAWRPFQLAFIILNLDGVFNLDQEARDTIDLVWFPTGGGKTEAYLALIALCIFHRRTNFPEAGKGTSVIMRYTLRLLAMQQFQRAARLILTLEIMRKKGTLSLGTEPITIGLWAGKEVTPNHFSTLRDDVNKMLAESQKNKLDAKNVKCGILQFFESCPVCNTPFISKSNGRQNVNYSAGLFPSELYCLNPNCSFSKKGTRIPISICDEEIYSDPPTLLFGTVDKFASLARKVEHSKKNDSRRLFGYRSKSLRCHPPDLIIQDELHLISGPLGSATGLVELAIHKLCTRTDGNNVTGPKIIASTATIKNAAQQIKQLYRKKVNLFPKPGPTIEDSFFTQFREKRNENESPKRRNLRSFLGILPTGRSNTWMQLRILAICLAHRIKSYDRLADATNGFDEILDQYHTVLSYYNSLRELGKTSSQLKSYLEKELRRVYKNILAPNHLYQVLYTDRLTHVELTGQESGARLKHAFRQIEVKFDPQSKPGPPDIVLATNLISVGLHVERLNTMIVNGMPRSISEYIQATSRVARKHPGLVLVIHHPYRVRDISHFEHFREFHEKTYQYVEPISVTPTTYKVLRRYLSLFCIALIRHKIEDLAEDDSAGRIVNESLLNKAKQLVHRVAVKDLNPEEKQLMEDCLNAVFNEWIERKQKERSELFGYEKSLFQTLQNTNSWWRVPHSLRTVEPTSAIRILP